MLETKIEKTLTETYTLRNKHCSWAKINLEVGKSSVNVMISGDYGEYNHYWGSTGENPKGFLTSIDMWYTMQKLMSGYQNMSEPDFIERKKRIKEMIIEARIIVSLSKDEARESWDELDNIFEYNDESIYYDRVMNMEYFNDIFYDSDSIPDCTKLKSKVELFWKHVWTPFTDELKRELSNENTVR